MWLVALFGLIVILSRFLSDALGEVTMLGLTFTGGAAMIALLLPLRDLIQERDNRGKALLAMFVGLVIGFFIFGGNAIATATALFFTEVVAFIVYSSLRHYGWGVAMPVASFVAAPLTPLIFFVLTTGSVGMPDGQIAIKYLTLAVVYGIFFVTNLPTRLTGLPKWRNLPQRFARLET